jgi:hypothetical protein
MSDSLCVGRGAKRPTAISVELITMGLYLD